MADVQLLHALIGEVAKTRKICSASLETRERLRKKVLRKVVIAGQMLVLGQLMIDFSRELIGALMPDRHSLEGSVRAVGMRHELVQEVERCLIETGCWNHVGRKECRIRGAVRNGIGSAKAKRSLTSRSVIQNVGIRQSPLKGWVGGEIAQTLRVTRHGDGI